MQNNGFENTVDAVAFNGRDSVCVRCNNYGGSGLVWYSDLLLRVSKWQVLAFLY